MSYESANATAKGPTARETCFDGYTPSVRSLAKRHCDNCESWCKKKGLGDFICRHTKGYEEAPASVKRCYDCEEWKRRKSIGGDFWCKHNKDKNVSGIGARDSEEIVSIGFETIFVHHHLP